MSLGKICYDPQHSAVFGSVSKLVTTSKNKINDFDERLSSQEAYIPHKAVRKSFPRNPYIVTNIDDCWEMDLADLSSFKI